MPLVPQIARQGKPLLHIDVADFESCDSRLLAALIIAERYAVTIDDARVVVEHWLGGGQ